MINMKTNSTTLELAKATPLAGITAAMREQYASEGYMILERVIPRRDAA